MNNSDMYYMEKDGAVHIPDKYRKMSHDEISAECVRLAKTVKDNAKPTAKKKKVITKTNFLI